LILLVPAILGRDHAQLHPVCGDLLEVRRGVDGEANGLGALIDDSDQAGVLDQRLLAQLLAAERHIRTRVG